MALSLNDRLLAIPPSGIRAVHDRKRPTSIDLSIGQPSLKPDPAPFLAATDWVREHGCPYAPYQGIPELREAVAALYGGRFHTSADCVCVTNGSQEAILLAVKALLRPGVDEALIVNPGYPSYARCCDLEGVAYRAVPCDSADGFRIHAEAVLEALRPSTRLIIIGSPANPSGATLRQRDVETLAQGLSARTGPPVAVLVDEVYREITFPCDAFASLADHYPHTLIAQSLSKSCALTGLRLGFLIGPAAAIGLATRIHQLMLMSVSQPAQRVALEIVRRPAALRAHHAWYARQRTMMIETAAANDLSIVKPDGAFYTLVRLPQRWNGDALSAAYRLLERYDVVTVPGSVFGNRAEGFLRVTWAAPERDVIEGLARIGAFVRSAS